MLCCHPRSQLTKVIGKWQSWNINPGALTLSLVLFSLCLTVCRIHSFLLFFLFCLPLGWIFWGLFLTTFLCHDSVLARAPSISGDRKPTWKRLIDVQGRMGSETGSAGSEGSQISLEVFSPSCFSSCLFLVFGLIHFLQMFPFCGRKYGRQQHLCVSPPRTTQE